MQWSSACSKLSISKSVVVNFVVVVVVAVLVVVVVVDVLNLA